MTEKPTDTDPTVSAAAGTASGTGQADAPSVPVELAGAGASPPVSSGADHQKPARSKSGKGTWTALGLLVLLMAALAAALWHQNQAIDRLGRTLVGHIDDVSTVADAAARDAGQALALARSQTATMQRLQTSLAEVRTQYQALQEAWDQINNGAGQTVLLNDIEQLLTQANQQLRLGGNIGNAIVALEIAQARLARTEVPNWTALQQAIDTDLSGLRALPVVDVAALTARVDQLIELTARAPLLASDVVTAGGIAPDAARAATPISRPVLPEDASWWQHTRSEAAFWCRRAWAALSREMRGLLSIRRVEDANVLLLAPEQTAQLRATLRMRLLTAQVALLMHQPAVWQSELATVSAALAANYDARSVDTMTAVQLARELGEFDVAVTLPDLGASLKAVAALRSADGQPSPGEE